MFPLLPCAQAVTDSTGIKSGSGLPVKSVNSNAEKISSDQLFDYNKQPIDSFPIKSEQAPVKAGPGVHNQKLFFFQQVQVDHPYYNFFGKPLPLIIENKEPGGNETVFYLILFLFFYFALIRLVFSKYFSDLFTLFFRATLRQQQLREQLLQSPLPSLFLNSLFVLSGSLYMALLGDNYKILPGNDFWTLWLYCLCLLIVIYTGKYLILKTFGWILKINRATDIYLFVVFMVNKMTGIFLLPILLIIAFPAPSLLPIAITLSFCMLVLLFGYRFIVSYRLIRKEIKLNLFHFFLYLCAFEIAPLLLIWKVLLKIVEVN